MKIVIPMAGRGSRFAGIKEPKPLIEILGKPMLQWSIESVQYSFPKAKPEDYIFISLAEHEKQFHITKRVENIIGSGFQIHHLPDVTDGPVCTVMSIEHLLDPEEDFFTIDCDQHIRCSQLATQIQKAQELGWAGLIPTFEAQSEDYSYVKLDPQGNASETAEKQVISSHAAAGIYYFSSTNIFMNAAREMVRDNLRTKNEFYMSPLYNIVIKQGGIVRIVPVEEWLTLGTPEDAKHFINTIQKKHAATT